MLHNSAIKSKILSGSVTKVTDKVIDLEKQRAKYRIIIIVVATIVGELI